MDNSTIATPFQWDEEKISILTRLREEGLSASEIAGEMGTTKGSVLGKLRRMGMFEPRTNGGAVLKGKAYVARKRKILAKNGNPHLPKGSVTLLDLKNNDCRFPVTDRPPHLFCAKPKWGASPYCCEHSALVWRKQA
jgi:hypothetical protein